MKKLFTMIGLLGVMLFCLEAKAQTPTYVPTVLWNGTNLANTGTNIASTFFVGKQQNVMLEWVCAATTGVGTNAIAVADSVDGVLFGPYRLYIMNALGSGTNVACTNIVVGGSGFMKVGFMTNWFMTGDLTNCYIKYGVKLSSP